MDEPKAEQFQTFVTHVLQGARFGDHSVPVTVLPELTAYRELILDVARALFFRDNTERQRVPKHFDDGLDLVLRGIGDGSAVASLERRQRRAPVVPARLLLPETAAEDAASDHFERARDLVSELIESIAAGRPVPPEFPVASVRLFNSFGQSLRDDESIGIRGATDHLVTYDRKVRKKIVLLREQTYEDVVDISGSVVQFDMQRGTFGIAWGGAVVSGPLGDLDERQLRIVRTAAVHTEELRVRVEGVGAYDRNDQLVRVVMINDLSLAEDEDLRAELDIESRLRALATLADGWLDGAGDAIRQAGLLWLTEILKDAEADGLHRPYLYPTPEGHVQAEWSFPGAEVSALFDLVEKTASCVGVHTRSAAHREDEVPLSDAAGLAKLVSFVGAFGP